MPHKVGSHRSPVAPRPERAPTKEAPAATKPAAQGPNNPDGSRFEGILANRGERLGQPQPAPLASSLRFDASNPEIQAFVHGKGWDKPGLRAHVYAADLVFTTDGWKTTHTAPLQYLYNNQQGFVIRDLPQGAQVEYAVHAYVGVSHDNFYSFDEKADVWANNGGGNYRSATLDPSGNG